MPVAKLSYSSTPDAMKPEDGNDTVDTFIRQAVEKEPFLSFSRAGDSPVQWIQLLQALDQQEHPGWPLLSPMKVQMQKCEKCSGEFCSPINYRRHIRVHRRSLKFDKDSTKNRDLLGAFWDKLSVDEAKEVVSFKDVTLEEVPGSSILKALTTLIRKPGFTSLPHLYVKAGSALLDIIQSRPSRFPISSHELFSILDDASERTFLCAGTADSIRKYVFDGEAGKIGLEMKNLVACTCFLLEQKLIKAWVADKDAEALRCQKLLVEEEEAAQKRQADLMEKRRKKKLRQKEQKAKEQTNVEKTNLMEDIADIMDDVPSAESSSSLASPHSVSCTPEAEQDHVSSLLEPIELSNVEVDADTEAQSGVCNGNSDSGTYQHVERRVTQRNSQRRLVARWKMPKGHKTTPNGIHGGQNSEVSKHATKHGAHRDLRAAPVVNGNKVWTRKPKSEAYGENLNSRGQKEAINQPDQIKNRELLIGSISVTLGNCSGPQDIDSLAGTRDNCGAEHPVPKRNNVEEKPLKSDAGQSGISRSTIMLWRKVSQHGSSGPTPLQSDCREPDVECVTGEVNELSSESCPRSSGVESNVSGSTNDFLSLSEETRGFQFSSQAAEAFLAQRWKEAIAADHVKLVLYPESEPPGLCHEIRNDSQEAVSTPAPAPKKRSILGNAENRLSSNAGGTLESSTWGNANTKFRTKPEKGNKLKYIPKQRNIASKETLPERKE